MTELKHPDQEKFKLLFTTTSPVEAEGVANLLAAEGIEAFPINKRDSTYMFGEIELYVNESEVERALKLLEANEIR
jgi:type III secretory pathway lipoprotein EscJ